MKKLITRVPKRLFTFGCSFTAHKWPTWADIIAKDLNIPFQNYGCGGAGNQYIFNWLMTSDNYHRFTKDDLIMVCWTNLAREDRYINGQWITPGNIFSQNVYDSSYVKKYADIFGYAVRDFAMIKATWEFLTHRQCQFHMLKMVDFEMADHWNSKNQFVDAENLFDQYKFYLDSIASSIYKVLWNNDIQVKFNKEKTEIHPTYRDGHPLVSEHFEYLQKTFDHKFRKYTVDLVEEKNTVVINRIKEYCDKKIAIWEDKAKFDDIFL